MAHPFVGKVGTEQEAEFAGLAAAREAAEAARARRRAAEENGGAQPRPQRPHAEAQEPQHVGAQCAGAPAAAPPAIDGALSAECPPLELQQRAGADADGLRQQMQPEPEQWLPQGEAELDRTRGRRVSTAPPRPAAGADADVADSSGVPTGAAGCANAGARKRSATAEALPADTSERLSAAQLRRICEQLRAPHGASARSSGPREQLAQRLEDAQKAAEARAGVTAREQKGARERLYLDAVTLGMARIGGVGPSDVAVR